MKAILALVLLGTLLTLFIGCAGDTTAPAITGVTVSDITSSAATITWTTDEPASSQVEYGLTATYGSTTASDTNMVTSHSVTLSGLSPSTIYYYVAVSLDKAGNKTTSLDWSFTTLTQFMLTDLQVANTEMHNAKTAVVSCMYEANKSTLTLHAPWDGTAGKVTATADDLSTKDASDFVNSAFKATYTFDVDGTLVSATLTPAPGNTAWTGIKWDSGTLSWVQA